MILLGVLAAFGAAAFSSIFALRRSLLLLEIFAYAGCMLTAARQSLLVLLITPGLIAPDESWPGFLSGLLIDYVLLPVAFLWILAGLWHPQATTASRSWLVGGWSAWYALLYWLALSGGIIRLHAPFVIGVLALRCIGILSAAWLFAVWFRHLLYKEGKLL
ncbi:hypothetical protein B5M42_014010 [Paenibacillus athensensis]|uniref:Uncharacterized protein n=1 Tax=Paenibacillus athensensis TaxID=1967502 RepID=A0A4Y8PXK6_9BACL|nr:hypothetical protein [Paenibacillus athensensis]MCD1259947.1 hypothetical protein [Paenibacillus athensensis]